jgi:hypothetical protein
MEKQDNKIVNRLTVHRFHKTLTDSRLNMDVIENMCCTMYKMGISPLTTIRKYLGKYDLSNIKVLFVDANTHRLNEMPVKMDHTRPTILVYLKESQAGPEIVKLKYYSAIENLRDGKYPLINFTHGYTR